MTRYFNPREDDAETGRIAKRLSKVADELIAAIGHDKPPSTAYRKLLKKAMLLAAEAHRELERRDRELAAMQQLCVTDTVTRLLNRRGFDHAIDRALGRARRFNETGLVLMIDLDGFKQINDAFGHSAGDLVLAAVATLLRVNTRDIDDVARIGGDEFAVILSNADSILGYQKAVQIENMLNNLSVPWEGLSIRVRASVGVTTFDETDDPQSVVRRADERMYGQKRNRPSRLTLEATAVEEPQTKALAAR